MSLQTALSTSFEDTLLREFYAILEEEGIDASQIGGPTVLKDMGLSSIQFLRVVGALEDLVGVPLDAGLSKVETVHELIGELARLKEAQA